MKHLEESLKMQETELLTLKHLDGLTTDAPQAMLQNLIPQVSVIILSLHLMKNVV
jgi:hypothetical protein